MKYRKESNITGTIRWSYIAPLLCYGTLLMLIWNLSLPLSPITRKIENNDKNLNKIEETFAIRLDKNDPSKSNLNNLKTNVEDKNEYLVNVNNQENYHKDQTEILKDVFKKADKNQNNKLDLNELAIWIRKKILEHISTAISNNYELFNQIDINPKNGIITWKEYHVYFLKKRGFVKFDRNKLDKNEKGALRSIKEQILRDKAYWQEAAKSYPNALTIDEFLAFTHPESSASNQLTLVDELYDKLDRNGDDFLTEEEFAVMQTDDTEGHVMIRQGENERRAEFRKTIDLNGDGKADRRELLHYVAPQSPRHSEHEAEALISIADMDHDNMLSLEEILAHPDLFLKSKMVYTGHSFHDEF